MTRCPKLADLEQFVRDDRADAALVTHLDSCDDCRQLAIEIQDNNTLFERVRRTSVDSEISPGRPASPHALQITGFEMLSEIHRGGQGVVYLARQEATNRHVALKILLAGAFATSRQLARFEREIELVAALDHPNVVTVHDSGHTGDGRLYLVMQYIDGQTLDAWLDEPGRTTKSIVRIFEGVCAGVSHAHQRGVMHRDLKPANIIIDADDRPHIVDFGLAKEVTGLENGDARRTVTSAGQFMGTLAYAAPEQTTGDVADTDVRTDVYAIGAMLYEALSGAMPVDIDGDFSEVLRRIRETPPKSFAAHPRPAHVRADRDLETIVLKSLAKEKERRYQSVGALREDLQHWLCHEPVNARRDSGWYVLRRTLIRHRAATMTGIAVLILIVGFAIAMSIAYGRARTEAAKAAQIVVFLEDTLGSVEGGAAGGEVTVRELLDEAVQWIELALSDQPEVAAAIQTTVGNSYRNLGLFEAAEQQLRNGLDTRIRLFGHDHPQVAESLSTIALLRRDEGKLDEARNILERVLAIRDQSLGRDDRSTAITLANLGLIHRDLGEYDDARRYLTESLDIRRRLFGELHSDVAMCYFNLATIESRQREHRQASTLHTQSLDIRRRILSPNHPDLSRSLIALAKEMLQLDDAAAAEPLLIEAVELRRQLHSPGHWKIAEALIDLAEVHIALNRHNDARPLLQEAGDMLAAQDDRPALRTRCDDLMAALDGSRDGIE